MTLKQNQLNWRGNSVSLFYMSRRTPVASGPDWPSRVPVARQPSSGALGLADRQLLMKPGRRVEGVCCRKGLPGLLSHASHVPGPAAHTGTWMHGYTPTHQCTHTHSFSPFLPCCTHNCTHEKSSHRGQCQLLECNHFLDRPHSFPTIPPHHPMTNIYTVRAGNACIITRHVSPLMTGVTNLWRRLSFHVSDPVCRFSETSFNSLLLKRTGWRVCAERIAGRFSEKGRMEAFFYRGDNCVRGFLFWKW